MFINNNNNNNNKFPQKLKTPQSGKNINICAVNKCDNNYRGSRKRIVRGGGKTKNPPPPPTYGEMASTWREKTAHIEKIPP